MENFAFNYSHPNRKCIVNSYVSCRVQILIIVVSAIILMGCEDMPKVSILPKDVKPEEGDVVFRLGDSFESSMVNLCDSASFFSHVGIVVGTDSCLMVVHAVPGEPDFEGDVSRVKMEPIDLFFRSDKASLGAIKRHTDGNVAKNASQCALAIYKEGVLFDSDFDDFDTTKMYCCELVNHVYEKCGHQLCPKGLHQGSVLFFKLRNCTYPSDIFESEELVLIKTFKNQRK